MESAIWDQISTLQGWTDYDKCQAIIDQVVNGARLTVEIGVFGGRGLLALALAHKQYGGLTYGIDPWDNQACIEGEHDEESNQWWEQVPLKQIYDDFKNAVDKFEVKEQTRWVKARSEDVVTFFGDKTVDFLIIDGNHSTLKASTDIKLWHQKLHLGSTLLLDDTNWPTVQPCIQLLEELGYELLKDTGMWRLYRLSSIQ